MFFQKSALFVFILISVLTTYNYSFGQSDKSYSFVGFIKANEFGVIPYKLTFTEHKNGKITGETNFDFNGANSTKSTIEGSLSKKGKRISFKEVKNLSTKSDFAQDEFCFIEVDNIKLKQSGDNTVLGGKFSSSFPSGESCIEGNIFLISTDILELFDEKLAELDSTDSKKNVIGEWMELAREDKTVLKNDEELKIPIGKNDEITLFLMDKFQEDKDRVSIFCNDVLVERDLEIKNEKQKVVIPCKDKTCRVKILALNEGTTPPNTVDMEIQTSGNNSGALISLTGRLHKGESLFIQFERK